MTVSESLLYFLVIWCQCCGDLDLNFIFFHSALTTIKTECVLKMTEEARNVFLVHVYARVCMSEFDVDGD